MNKLFRKSEVGSRNSFYFGKKGSIGIGFFLAFIAIVLILGSFFALGKLSVTFEKSQGGVVVLDEDEVEIGNLFEYMDDYVKVVEVKVLNVKELEVSG